MPKVSPSPDLCVNRALEWMSQSFVIKGKVVCNFHPMVGGMGREKDMIRDTETQRHRDTGQGAGGHMRRRLRLMLDQSVRIPNKGS